MNHGKKQIVRQKICSKIKRKMIIAALRGSVLIIAAIAVLLITRKFDGLSDAAVARDAPRWPSWLSWSLHGISVATFLWGCRFVFNASIHYGDLKDERNLYAPKKSESFHEGVASFRLAIFVCFMVYMAVSVKANVPDTESTFRNDLLIGALIGGVLFLVLRGIVYLRRDVKEKRLRDQPL